MRPASPPPTTGRLTYARGHVDEVEAGGGEGEEEDEREHGAIGDAQHLPEQGHPPAVSEPPAPLNPGARRPRFPQGGGGLLPWSGGGTGARAALRSCRSHRPAEGSRSRAGDGLSGKGPLALPWGSGTAPASRRPLPLRRRQRQHPGCRRTGTSAPSPCSLSAPPRRAPATAAVGACASRGSGGLQNCGGERAPNGETMPPRYCCCCYRGPMGGEGEVNPSSRLAAARAGACNARAGAARVPVRVM